MKAVLTSCDVRSSLLPQALHYTHRFLADSPKEFGPRSSIEVSLNNFSLPLFCNIQNSDEFEIELSIKRLPRKPEPEIRKFS